MGATLSIGGSADGARKAIGEVSAELTDLQAETKEAADLAKQMGETLEDSLSSAEKQAKETAGAVKAVGGTDVVGKLTALFTGFTAGVQILKGMSQAARDARQYIKEAAEGGNAAFVELNETITHVENRFAALVTRAASSDLGKSMLKGVVDYAQQAVEGLDAVGDSADVVATAWNAIGSAVASSIGATEWEASYDARLTQLSAEASAQRMAIEAEQEKQIAAKQTGDVAKVVADLQKSREAERQQNAVNEITDIGQINALRERELATMRKLASEGDLTDEKKLASLQKIGSYEARRRQLLVDAASERKRQIEEIARAEEKALQDQYDAEVKAAKDYADLQEKAAKEERDRVAQEVKDREAAEKLKLEAADKAAAERQKRLDAIAGDKGIQGTAGQIKAAAEDPRAIAARLADNAAKKAEYVARLDGGGVSKSEEADIAAARRKAFRQANAQANGGPQVFDEKQVAQAVAQNMNAQVQSLQKTGGLQQDTVDGLKQVVNITQQHDQETAQLSQEVAQIKQVLADLGGNSRKRAQRGGR